MYSHSNIATWRVHNALLIIRLTLKYILENQSEAEAILQLDGSATIPQITSLEEKTRAVSLGSDGKEPPGVPNQTRGVTIPLSNGSHGSSSATSPFSQVSGSTLMSLAGKTAGSSADGGQRGGGGETIKRGGGGAKGGSINPAEVAAMEVLLSRQLVEGLVCLLAEVPLL
jgi:hypothetical protein